MKSIIILDDIFSDIECRDIIDYYTFHGPTKLHGSYQVMDINLEYGFFQDKVQKIYNAVNSYEKNVVPDWGNITLWPTGSYHPLHIDGACEYTILTSVLYLNSNYEGGETFFEDNMKVKPKPGRMVFFNGAVIPHGVNRVISKIRYTFPIWWKLKDFASLV